MFTGLIEAVGTVGRREDFGNTCRFQIESPFAPELQVGESVAVNGSCLTVEKADNHGFSAFASTETLQRTNLNALEAGGRVNLERALRLGERLGGHWVSGHVDGLGRFLQLQPQGEGFRLQVEAPEEILRLSVWKGSIAVDGISLTLSELHDRTFAVAVIPQTVQETTIREWQEGRQVNLEADLIGKYVAKFTAHYGQEARPNRFPAGSILDLIEREN